MTKLEQLTRVQEWIIGAQYNRVSVRNARFVRGPFLCVDVNPVNHIVTLHFPEREVEPVPIMDWHRKYRLFSLPEGHRLSLAEQVESPKTWIGKVHNNRL